MPFPLRQAIPLPVHENPPFLLLSASPAGKMSSGCGTMMDSRSGGRQKDSP
ncbi:hypothetical protein HMPREF1326_00686 [Akkermansia sp. KLE1605]|nr:hypothetical protein HMPREF1326_00686 [Akkermansia sp. KLE1605]